MTNFDFKSTKVFFMCTVNGDGVTINNISFTTINVELLTNAELLTLAKGVYFGHLITNDNSAFETYYTGILGDITSNGGVGGSVSPEIVQDIVGGMFDEGILITSDYNDTTGKIQLTPLPGVFIKDFIDRTYGSAHVYGGLITPTGGVNFSIASGGGYARNIDGEIVFVEWTDKTESCAADGNNFIGIDSYGNTVQSSSQLGPDVIALGYINTALGNTTVAGYSNINNNSTDANYWVNQWVRNAVGANVEFGCNIAALPSPNDLSIVMGSGRVWAQFNQIDLLDKYNFTKIYGTTAGFIPNTLDPNVVDPNYINDRNQAPGSALIPMTAGYFKKDMIFTTAEGNLYYVYATSEWPTLEEAQKAPLPDAPSSIRAQIIRLAGIVLEQGGTTIADIMDTRPMFSRLFETGTSAIPSTAISHSDLTDLGVDSHTQYHNDARGDARYYRKIEVDTLLSSKSDTGHAHSNATNVAAGFMSSVDKSKLDGISSGATANSTDVYLLSRSNHTGTQDVSTITGLTKASVGLGNVDNTADIDKPISTATQTALNGKSNTGHTHVIADVTGLQTALDGKEPVVAGGTTSQYYRGDKTFQTLDKTAVGLANVDNTSDASKPISTATQTALNGKEATVVAGTTGQYYRGDKTWQTLDKTAVGLSNVDNTSDVDKPISTATQTALDGKISGAVDVGAGAGVYKDTVANNLRFKSIVAGTTKGISIEENADDITLDNKFAKHPQNIYITQFDDFYTAQVAQFLQVATGGTGAGIVQTGQPVFGGTDKRFGIKVYSTGIATTGYAGNYGIYATPNFGNLVDGDYIEFSTSLRVPTLSSGVNRYTVYAGFTDQTTGTEGVDGAYFKYSDNLSAGNFQVVTSNNSTRTIADSGIAVVADTDYTLRVRVKNVGGTISADFYINGTAVATNVTTNLPITSLRTTSMAIFIVKSLGTTNRTFEADWVYFEYKTSRNITL